MATLKELAALVDGEVVGDESLEVSGFNDLQNAGAGEISFLADLKRQKQLAACRAAALIVPRELEPVDGRPLLRVDNPYLAATLIQNFFAFQPFVAAGVHPSAVIDEGCRLPTEVTIGPLAVLGKGVRLGQRVVIGAGVVVGDQVEIGDEVVLHPNVTIYPRCRIGNWVIIHAGSVIGSDGFGYATTARGRHVKRMHQGIVVIGDEVEIGANVCVDRATFGETVIGAGTKIDNLVQIGHNVEIGESCLLAAQAGIAGSTCLGKLVVLGGQAGIAGHLELADGVMVAGQSGVHNNRPAGAKVAGYPAIDYKKWLRASAAAARLPEMARELRELRRQVEQLAGGATAGDDANTKEPQDE
ncbi:MAG TPA: UDP-3-O-(3-hydroxymyristoyl)glucosamine N-acyltransferase [Desulfurivibrio alkaliphilus]|uniref:UDP-3-O-acylglucosamine N-acyltransferase n=1 Tax=Desulfurivibrio alkaliphilus TaxID=427923 RepID=A0A7C2TMX8_9BACT|nr:UDP-3-O-(3-hydroxymyristoyl)glucosamine N-acyltransferase [Desulfurivibrio alkaliphilus]